MRVEKKDIQNTILFYFNIEAIMSKMRVVFRIIKKRKIADGPSM